MDRLELTGFSRIHLIGIGGIGVSAVARLLLARGFKVSGSDVRESSITRAIRGEGAIVNISHSADNVKDADLVVRSTAIPDQNPELRAALASGIKVVHRSEVLDALMAGRRSVGVTGTNGKGSVSAMIAYLLDCAGLSPSFAIGAILLNFKTNAREGKGRHIVCELDESDGSFANTNPDVLVINNLEADHLNYYKDLKGLLDAFAAYLASGRPQGGLYVNGDDPNIRTVLERTGVRAVTFGKGAGCSFRVTDFRLEGMRSSFGLSGPEGDLGWFDLSLPGEYNIMNAAAALAVVLSEGVAPDRAREALPGFSGLLNRFTLRKVKDFFVVKDFISHPTGIRSVLAGARGVGKGRLIAVFKPYRFTMIHYLHNEYREAFRGADLTVLTEMYPAGEVPIQGVDTEWLAERIRSGGSIVEYVPEMEAIPEALHRVVQPGDIVVFFGGDDLFEVADRFAAEIEGA